jgi:predicted amidohydrolase YtcJ
MDRFSEPPGLLLIRAGEVAGEGIAIYASGSAAIERQQHRKGRLAPGYLADFVVLEADPRRTQPEGHAALRLDA